MEVNNSFDIIPMVSIHPTKLNIYSVCQWHKKKAWQSSRFKIETVKKDHNGKVSIHAKRKIGKAIEYLLFLAREKELPDTYNGRNYKFKLAFITLTLPSKQIHSDQIIKDKCLNQFLIEARKKFGVKNYLWRAEKQINGNIHFHILVDKFIPWNELRNIWNRIINKLDYVSNYRAEMRKFHSGGFQVRKDLLKQWSYKSQIKAYNAAKIRDWDSPNSTDIHSVHKVKNIQAYVSKYCTKDEQNAGLTGRLWGCNEALSNIPGAQLIMDSEVNDAIVSLFNRYSPRTYEGSYFTSISIEFAMLNDSDSDILFQAFGSFLLNHFGTNYQKQINLT